MRLARDDHWREQWEARASRGKRERERDEEREREQWAFSLVEVSFWWLSKKKKILRRISQFALHFKVKIPIISLKMGFYMNSSIKS